MPRIVTANNAILRREAVTRQALADYGYKNLTELARACGLDGSTMRRVYARQINPGQKFITAMINTTGKTYDQLFETVTELSAVFTPGDKGYEPGDLDIGNVRPKD